MIDFVSDTIVKWEVYNQEKICANFSFDDWSLIASDIKDDEEWKVFVNENCRWLRCYVLRTCSNNKEIGFVYIYNESGNFDVVSIHGGGWGKSIVSTLFYYRGMILMLRQLLNEGLKIRTTISADNLPALRFMRSLGFVSYRNINKKVFLWINEKRLKNSAVYKRYRV